MYLTCIFSWKGKGLIVLAEKLKITKKKVHTRPLFACTVDFVWLLKHCLQCTYSIFGQKANAWFNFTCYHPLPGQPRGQVQPFGPGGGELFEEVLSRG